MEGHERERVRPAQGAAGLPAGEGTVAAGAIAHREGLFFSVVVVLQEFLSKKLGNFSLVLP